MEKLVFLRKRGHMLSHLEWYLRNLETSGCSCFLDNELFMLLTSDVYLDWKGLRSEVMPQSMIIKLTTL